MLLGWAAVAFVAWAAFLSYSYLAVVDLAKVANGGQPSVFLNESDTFGFLVLLLILGTVAVGLSIHRPLKHPANGRADA